MVGERPQRGEQREQVRQDEALPPGEVLGPSVLPEQPLAWSLRSARRQREPLASAPLGQPSAFQEQPSAFQEQPLAWSLRSARQREPLASALLGQPSAFRALPSELLELPLAFRVLPSELLGQPPLHRLQHLRQQRRQL